MASGEHPPVLSDLDLCCISVEEATSTKPKVGHCQVSFQGSKAASKLLLKLELTMSQLLLEATIWGNTSRAELVEAYGLGSTVEPI